VDSIDEWNREGNENDRWTYIWGSGIFQSKQAYQNIIRQAQAPASFWWLWKSQCQAKHKVFFWLLLNDQLNTRNLLRWKRFNIPTVSCVLCSCGIDETVKHLIFECEFAQLCWTLLHIIWDLSLPVIEMIEEQKGQFPNGCFMEVIIMASWSIWIHRNSIIFDNQQLSTSGWKKEFNDLFIICTHRAKPGLEADM
jgi:hypothetical protein